MSAYGGKADSKISDDYHALPADRNTWGSRDTPALRRANPGLALPADAAFANFDCLGIVAAKSRPNVVMTVFWRTRSKVDFVVLPRRKDAIASWPMRVPLGAKRTV